MKPKTLVKAIIPAKIPPRPRRGGGLKHISPAVTFRVDEIPPRPRRGGGLKLLVGVGERCALHIPPRPRRGGGLKPTAKSIDDVRVDSAASTTRRRIETQQRRRRTRKIGIPPRPRRGGGLKHIYQGIRKVGYGIPPRPRRGGGLKLWRHADLSPAGVHSAASTTRRRIETQPLRRASACRWNSAASTTRRRIETLMPRIRKGSE